MNLQDPVNDAVDEAKKKADDLLHSDQVEGAKDKANELKDAADDKLNDLKEGAQGKVEQAKDAVDDWREKHDNN